MVYKSEAALNKVILATESESMRIWNSLKVFDLFVTFSVESSSRTTASNSATLDEPIQLTKETNGNKTAALVEM